MTEQEYLASADPVAMLKSLTREWEKGGTYYVVSDRKLRLFACACYRTLPGADAWFRDSQALWCVEAAEALADGLPLPTWQGDTVDSGRALEHIGLEILCHCTRENAADAARMSAASPLEGRIHEGLKARHAALLRDIIGNPFRPTAARDDGWLILLRRDRPDSPVHSLARAAYGERSTVTQRRDCDAYRGRGWFRDESLRHEGCAKCHGTGILTTEISDGTLDPARLGILSDALEEEGCTDEALLRHLRGEYHKPHDHCHYCGGSGIDQEALNRPHVHYMVPPRCQRCSGGKVANTSGWRRLSGPHVRGCWALDLVLGLE